MNSPTFQYVLGVYTDPQLIRVVFYGNTVSEPTGIIFPEMSFTSVLIFFSSSSPLSSFPLSHLVMLLDYGTPLSSIISTFQAVFKLSDDFTFFKYSLETHQSIFRSISLVYYSFIILPLFQHFLLIYFCSPVDIDEPLLK